MVFLIRIYCVFIAVCFLAREAAGSPVGPVAVAGVGFKAAKGAQKVGNGLSKGGKLIKKLSKGVKNGKGPKPVRNVAKGFHSLGHFGHKAGEAIKRVGNLPGKAAKKVKDVGGKLLDKGGQALKKVTGKVGKKVPGKVGKKIEDGLKEAGKKLEKAKKKAGKFFKKLFGRSNVKKVMIR